MAIYKNVLFIAPDDKFFYNDEKAALGGAAYNQFGYLISNSLRKSDYAAMKHIAAPSIELKKHITHKIINEESVYAGHFHKHFGHFLIETLPELYKAKLTGKKIVVQRFRDRTPTAKYLELDYIKFLLSKIGVDLEDLIFIEETMLFRSLEINERITTINHSISGEAKSCFEKISKQILSDKNYEKIYFSRSQVRNRPSPIGLDEFMKDNGYLVVHPQRHSVLEQIEIIKNAKVLAGYHGSALHLSVFCTQCVVQVFGCSKHINIEMMNNLMGHKTFYIHV